MIDWFWTILGICLGNTLWLAGMIMLGVAVWAYRVKPHSIEKTVRMMRAMTGGKPRGFALRLKGLIDPVDRTREFGGRLLVASIIILVIGCSFIARCA